MKIPPTFLKYLTENQKPFCRRINGAWASFYFTCVSLEHKEMRTSCKEGEGVQSVECLTTLIIMTSYLRNVQSKLFLMLVINERSNITNKNNQVC